MVYHSKDIQDKVSKYKLKIKNEANDEAVQHALAQAKRMKDKFVDLEDIARRNNFRFDQFSENGKKSLKVKHFTQNELEIENDIIIKRTRRTGKMKREYGMVNKKRTIVVRFLNYKDK